MVDGPKSKPVIEHDQHGYFPLCPELRVGRSSKRRWLNIQRRQDRWKE